MSWPKKPARSVLLRLKLFHVKWSSEIGADSSEYVTRATGYRPEDNMNKKKIAKFLRIIQTYLQDKHMEKVEWSMALVAVRVDTAKKKARVRFIEDLVF